MASAPIEVWYISTRIVWMYKQCWWSDLLLKGVEIYWRLINMIPYPAAMKAKNPYKIVSYSITVSAPIQTLQWSWQTFAYSCQETLDLIIGLIWRRNPRCVPPLMRGIKMECFKRVFVWFAIHYKVAFESSQIIGILRILQWSEDRTNY